MGASLFSGLLFIFAGTFALFAAGAASAANEPVLVYINLVAAFLGYIMAFVSANS